MENIYRISQTNPFALQLATFHWSDSPLSVEQWTNTLGCLHFIRLWCMHEKPADCCGFDKINYPGIRSYGALCILFTSLTGGKITSHPGTAENYPSPMHCGKLPSTQRKISSPVNTPLKLSSRACWENYQTFTSKNQTLSEKCALSTTISHIFQQWGKLRSFMYFKTRNKIYSTKTIKGTFLSIHKCSSFVIF